MDQLLPPWSPLAAFITASLLLAVTPGLASRTSSPAAWLQGRRAGLASVAGIALGNLGVTRSVRPSAWPRCSRYLRPHLPW